MSIPYATPVRTNPHSAGLKGWGTLWLICGGCAAIASVRDLVRGLQDHTPGITVALLHLVEFFYAAVTGATLILLGVGMAGARRWCRPVGLTILGYGAVRTASAALSLPFATPPRGLSSAFLAVAFVVSIAVATLLYGGWTFLRRPSTARVLYERDPHASWAERWPVEVLAVATLAIWKLPNELAELALQARATLEATMPHEDGQRWWPVISAAIYAVRIAILMAIFAAAWRRKGGIWVLATTYLVIAAGGSILVCVLTPDLTPDAVLHADPSKRRSIQELLALGVATTAAYLIALSVMKPALRTSARALQDQGEPIATRTPG